MAWNEDHIVLLDFEEDPLQVMSLAEAQARDILLFLTSAARPLENDQARLAALFESYIKCGGPAATIDQLYQFPRSNYLIIKCLDRMPARLFGRDVNQGLTAIRAILSVKVRVRS